MNWFYLLLAISLGYGLPTKDHAEVPAIEKPSIKSVTALDNSFEVEWTAVEQVKEEPTLGYKLYIWEVEDENNKNYVDEDGKIVLVKEEIKPAEVDLYKVPIVKPNVIDIPVGTTKYNYGPRESKKTYIMRVAAYGLKGEGDMSDAVTLR